MKQIATGIFSGSLDWTMLGLGVAVGVVVIVLDVVLRNSGKGALPPLAVGLGIYLPPTIGLTLTIGAVLGFSCSAPSRPTASVWARTGRLRPKSAACCWPRA